jgi:hypothetical protein
LLSDAIHTLRDLQSTGCVPFPGGSSYPRRFEMKGHVALVREQGVNFAVVAVKPHVLNKPKRGKDDLVAAYSREFGVPAVLMAQDARGRATYYGRPDLVRFLSQILFEQLPWREVTIRAA